ncbi:G-protein coupled receptor 37-like 1 [Narcine bancroftii]|uniref:G-protein coupled receptor 37-like 1 n=1 Tax=Narcine bancroftii TaxID=1343680 RepID=UPI0038311D2C
MEMSLSFAILFLLWFFVSGFTASGTSEGQPDLSPGAREGMGELANRGVGAKVAGAGAPSWDGGNWSRGRSGPRVRSGAGGSPPHPEFGARRGAPEDSLLPAEASAASLRSQPRHLSPTPPFQVTSRTLLSPFRGEGGQLQGAGERGVPSEQSQQVETTAKRLQLENGLSSVADTTYSAYAVVLLSLILFAVGIIGNLAVMCIVCHNYYMKSAWNNILAGMACWDFFVTFFCLPVVVFNEITKKRLLGDIGCKVVPYMEVSSLGVTTFSLCALSIDGFRSATTVQSQIRLIESCLSIIAKMAVIWIGSMLLALPEVLLWQLDQKTSIISGVITDYCIMQTSSNLPEHIYGLALTYENSRMWWYFGCYFCLPVIFTVSCQLVTRRVKNTEKKADLKSTSKLGHYESQRNYTLIGLTILYSCCIIPENISSIVVGYTSEISKGTIDLLNIINQFFLFFKSSVTPVLVLCLCKPLGLAFMDCCCCCCDECTPEPSGSDVRDRKLKMEMASIFCHNPKETTTTLTLGTQC